MSIEDNSKTQTEEPVAIEGLQPPSSSPNDKLNKVHTLGIIILLLGVAKLIFDVWDKIPDIFRLIGFSIILAFAGLKVIKAHMQKLPVIMERWVLIYMGMSFPVAYKASTMFQLTNYPTMNTISLILVGINILAVMYSRKLYVSVVYGFLMTFAAIAAIDILKLIKLESVLFGVFALATTLENVRLNAIKMNTDGSSSDRIKILSGINTVLFLGVAFFGTHLFHNFSITDYVSVGSLGIIVINWLYMLKNKMRSKIDNILMIFIASTLGLAAIQNYTFLSPLSAFFEVVMLFVLSLIAVNQDKDKTFLFIGFLIVAKIVFFMYQSVLWATIFQPFGLIVLGLLILAFGKFFQMDKKQLYENIKKKLNIR